MLRTVGQEMDFRRAKLRATLSDVNPPVWEILTMAKPTATKTPAKSPKAQPAKGKAVKTPAKKGK
jgi:hypothetical protein